MTWLRIAFVDAITHAVSDRLMPSLVAEMTARGHGIENFEAKYGAESAAALGGNPMVVTDWGFDIGGPCHIHRPMETVTVDGLAIGVPCEQFDYIVRGVEESKIRRFATGDLYYKLKFWRHATVLTPEQRDSVLCALDALHQNADQRARSFADAIRRGQEAGVS